MFDLIMEKSRHKDNDTIVHVFLYRGIIDRNIFHQSPECAEIFRRCGCAHDCCGHWFAHYILDYHHNRDGNTAIAVVFSRNV